MSERHIEVDGRKIFLREKGNGSPVVLLHGFPQTGDVWTPVADKLAGRNRIIIPDLPGFGKSDAAPSASARDVATLLVRALEANGIDKFVVVGHDFGGSIAFQMALAYPERIEKLVVVNAPFRHLNLLRGAHMLLFNVPIIPEVLLTVAGKQLVPLMVRLASSRRDMLEPEQLKRYAESMSDMRHARDALAYYRTTTRAAVKKMLPPILAGLLGGRGQGSERDPDADATPRKIEVPTLLVWGMRDPVLPPSLIPTIRRDVENLEVVKLRDVGHFVPDEAPDELAHAIDKFLQKIE